MKSCLKLSLTVWNTWKLLVGIQRCYWWVCVLICTNFCWNHVVTRTGSFSLICAGSVLCCMHWLFAFVLTHLHSFLLVCVHFHLCMFCSCHLHSFSLHIHLFSLVQVHSLFAFLPICILSLPHAPLTCFGACPFIFMPADLFSCPPTCLVPLQSSSRFGQQAEPCAGLYF